MEGKYKIEKKNKVYHLVSNSKRWKLSNLGINNVSNLMMIEKSNGERYIENYGHRFYLTPLSRTQEKNSLDGLYSLTLNGQKKYDAMFNNNHVIILR